MNDQFGKVIHFGAVTVDQHQMGTAEIAQQTGSRVDDQRGPADDEQVRCLLYTSDAADD